MISSRNGPSPYASNGNPLERILYFWVEYYISRIITSMINTICVYLNRNRQKSHRTTCDKSTSTPPYDDISAKKSSVRGRERRGEGGRVGVSLGKVTKGDRYRLIYWAKCAYCFLWITFIFFRFWACRKYGVVWYIIGAFSRGKAQVKTKQ